MPSQTSPDLDAEYRQIREECGLLHRARTSIEVRGPEAAEYLQGQITNQVEELSPGSGCYAALLDRKGHIQADMRVLRPAEQRFLIDTPEVAGAKVLKHLGTYMIGREVEVSETALDVISLIGPGSREVTGLAPGAEFNCVEAKIAGADCLVTATDVGLDLLCEGGSVAAVTEQLLSDHAVPVSEAAAEIIRVESGRPRLEFEMSGAPMPAEAGIVERAVDFTKGCYVGQEPVARLHYRGKPNRFLRGLVLDGPAGSGDTVRLGDRELGTIGTAVLSPASGRLALAILRKEGGPGDRVTVETTDGEVAAKVADLPFVEEPAP